MSSGMGLRGNESRCFKRFEMFSVCMKEEDEPLKQCLALRNDYLECLHHKKELKRVQTIAAEAERQANGGGSGGHGGGH